MNTNLRNTIIAMIIALVCGVVAIFLFKSNHTLQLENQRLSDVIQTKPQREFEPVIDTIFETVITKRDTMIQKYRIIKRNQHANVAESSIPISYMDSVARALKIGEHAISEQLRLNIELKKELQKEKLVKKELQEKIWQWKDKHSQVIANLNDSTVQVNYDAKITVTDYKKKSNWFSRPEYFTAISTNDENLKINGVQRFEQKVDVTCRKINFGLQGGVGLVSPLFDGATNIHPGYYLGTGVQFNF